MKSMKSTVQRTDEDELLKIMGDKSPVGVCIIQDGKFCYVNSNFPIATGYTADELVDSDPLELIVPEDREMVRENEIKMLKGELIPPYQFRVIHKDGSIRWVMEAVRSVQYHGRRAVLGNYMEVTERKQAEDALKESGEKYRELADSITDIFFAMDKHLRYIYWNKASEILTGIRAEDAIGKSLREIFPDTPGMRKAEKVYRNVLKTQQPQTFVNDTDIDGRHYIFEISAYPSRGGISVFVKDITERKQAEEKLEESEQKYRLLFETSLDCIAQIDREGRFLAANPASARSLGVPLEELIGKTFFEVMPQEVAQHRLETVRKVLDEWQPQIVEDERAGRYFHHIDIPTKISDQKEVVQVITRDITERRQMEEALRQSEEKYRALFDSSVIGMFVMDAETMKMVMCNGAAAKMFGFSSAEEAIGINPVDFIIPEERDRDLEIIMKGMFERDLRQTHEFRVLTKDGRKGWISVTGARIVHEGSLAGLVSITNINRRKQVEERLKESEQKYRLLFETSPDYIVQIDKEGRYLAANPATARSLGVPLEELIGKTVFEVQPQEVAQYRLKMVRKTLDEWQPQIFEDERAGRYFHHIFIPTKTPDQKEAVQGITRDITERREMEEALRQSEENYKTLFNSSVVGMYVLDIETMKIVMGNRAAQEMVGISSAEEGIGINPFDFVVPEDREKVIKIAVNEFLQDSRRTHEVQVVDKNGQRGWQSFSIARITHQGKLASLVSISNITERKQAEEALRRSEERYRTTLEEMEDSYFEVDLAGNLTFVNNSVCRDLGYSMEELIGMSYKGFTVEDDIESVFRVFNEVYRTGVPNKGFPWKTTRKDGSHGFAETSISLLRNNKGEVIGFRGVGRDVTERKQSEEKLRQSEENYKTLFDSSVIGMYVLDAETFKVVMGNRVAAEMAGFSSAGEGVGINPLDFVIPEDREQVLEMAVKEFEQDLRRTHEVRVIAKDGGIGWINISSARITHEGRPASLVSITNITERKRMEEVLRQSEENYRALFDSSVIGTFVIDAETMKIVIGNRAAAKMFGFSSVEEGIGVNPLDFVHPEDRERYLEIARKELFEQDLRRTQEWQAITKDGREIWVSITGARIMHEGRLAALVSFIDITERKQTEEKLRQSKENYRALFDSAVIGALVVDAETMKVVMANEATLKMFGFGSPEAGVNPLDFIPPEDRQKNLELIVKEVFEKDSRKSVDLPVVTKDGKKMWVSVTGARIMHKGKLAGLFSFTDITERKQAEEALRQSEENYRALFDSSVIGTVLLDAETFKVVMVNQAALKMFGFSSAEEAFEAKPLDFILPEDREKYLEITKKAVFEQNSHEGYQLRAVTKDGREIWINTTATMVTHRGKLAALISFADITEQKKQSERLMMTDRLASLGELASGTAHELNNPLTSIIGFSQLLMEREVPDDIREDLKLINNEAQRAASVTKNLLTFARKHAPVKQRNHINNIIEDVLKLRAYEHRANGIEVERQLGPDLPEIMVDYFQMQQVFMNIIINAEYFMVKEHNKGTLTITTKKQNNTVMISIADDGPGIPPENLKRIFDPFFTTKEAGKGTGLGLSICHGIVTEHGGQIYAKSQPGKGATIFVELPISGS
jgi:PAS domain S-box-containing protein